MNALVTFRTNSAGNLVASRTQRQAADVEMRSNVQRKIEGALRRLAAKSGTGTTSSASAKSASSTSKTAKSSSSDTSTESDDDTLDRDAFLQLLVTQMQNQDPLDPVDNSEMIAQLAQFSTLEQMTNLNESFGSLAEEMEYLVGNVDQLNFLTAQGMLGRYVTGFNLDNEQIEGYVESVTLDGSIVILTVDGEYMPMTGVVAVGTDASASSSTDTESTETES